MVFLSELNSSFKYFQHQPQSNMHHQPVYCGVVGFVAVWVVSVSTTGMSVVFCKCLAKKWKRFVILLSVACVWIIFSATIQHRAVLQEEIILVYIFLVIFFFCILCTWIFISLFAAGFYFFGALWYARKQFISILPDIFFFLARWFINRNVREEL